jgi:hypothetical protein
MRLFRAKNDPLIGSTELVVEAEQAEVGTFALELTLLIEGLSEMVVILTPAGYRISLSIQKKEEKGLFEARTRVTQVDPMRMSFEIARTQAMYMQATLLRAYRDEMAAVNHVHIEGFLRESPFDLTLLFATSRPPMTPEEIERMTGY